MKYADEIVLLSKEETMLQSMIGRMTEIGMEMNVEKAKVMRISRKHSQYRL
jgi:hypothetical protein